MHHVGTSSLVASAANNVVAAPAAASERRRIGSWNGAIARFFDFYFGNSDLNKYNATFLASSWPSSSCLYKQSANVASSFTSNGYECHTTKRSSLSRLAPNSRFGSDALPPPTRRDLHTIVLSRTRSVPSGVNWIVVSVLARTLYLAHASCRVATSMRRLDNECFISELELKTKSLPD